ncbi:MAG TPA: CopD family protein [Bordetella sp.]
MLYIWLRLLHVAVLTIWLLGMLAASVACFPSGEAQAPSRFVLGMARWNSRVTTPAMLLTWLCGLSLASMAGWFGQNWLTAKIVIALVLSGVHGLQTAGLRRLCAGERAPGVLIVSGMVVVLGAMVALSLAFVKPDF